MKRIHYGYDDRELTVDEVVSKYVPEGWENLVRELIYDLFEMGWCGQLFQVKEKYGGLRFYANVPTEMQGRLDRAERESYTTCQSCGASGTCREGGWIRILCDDCYGESLSIQQQ